MTDQELYQERMTVNFELRNRLSRFEPYTEEDRKALCTQTAPNGEKFQEICINKQPNRAEAENALSICLDSFVDTWRLNHAGEPLRVYWRIMPEVCQSEARGGLWRGYARLALG